MIVFFIGGAASGKSERAEEVVLSLAGRDGGHPLYYVATMEEEGEEARRRIRVHRARREGKGFQTLEAPRDILKAVQEALLPRDAVVLLECLSNLAANEYFAPENARKRETDSAAFARALSEKVLTELFALEERVGALVIVSNNIFSSWEYYDTQTTDYIRFLSGLNIRLCARSQEVYEVVCGLCLPLRKDNP